MPDGTGTAVAPALEIQEMESQPTHEQIAALAHALWMERGCPDGTPDVDWFQAEEQLRNR